MSIVGFVPLWIAKLPHRRQVQGVFCWDFKESPQLSPSVSLGQAVATPSHLMFFARVEWGRGQGFSPYLVWGHLSLGQKMRGGGDKKPTPPAKSKGIQQALSPFLCGWSSMTGTGWTERRGHHKVTLGMDMTAPRRGSSPVKSVVIQLLTNGSVNNSYFKQTLQPEQTKLLPAQSGSTVLWKWHLLKGNWSHLDKKNLPKVSFEMWGSRDTNQWSQ